MGSADYLAQTEMEHLMAALMPANRLALEISLATGLRIGDVLAIRTEQLCTNKITVREQKTGKRRTVTIPKKLCELCVAQSGKTFVFQGRLDAEKPRTVSAVYRDLRRVAKMWRLPANLQVSPHTCRKIYAVSQFQKRGSLESVQKLLGHENDAVTMLYAMADVLTERRFTGRYKKSQIF